MLPHSKRRFTRLEIVSLRGVYMFSPVIIDLTKVLAYIWSWSLGTAWWLLTAPYAWDGFKAE